MAREEGELYAWFGLVDPDHDVEGMPESDDIVAYLEKTYGSAA